MSKVIAIVQGRIGSQRLPRKTLLELPKGSGVTVIERIRERLLKCLTIQKVVLTTPNKELVDLWMKNTGWLNLSLGTSLYTKPKRDVLDEFMHVAKYFPADHYVRITADCPLIIPKVVDHVVASHLLSGADYTYNHNDIDGDMTGDGQDTEVFTWETLVKTWAFDQSDYGREHVTPYMKNFKVNQLQPYAWEGKSLNEKADYKLLCKIYEKYRLD